MRKFIALLLAVVMVFGVAGSAVAITPGAIFDEIDIMEANGKLSNGLITQAIIDLSFIESQGTVVATVYDSVYENKTVNTYTDLLKQPPWPCVTKLTHFIFELTNQYRLQETDIAISIGSYDTDLTVSTYVYGQYKDQAMLAILSGIPDCLGNEPYRPSKGGGSWIDPYTPENIGTDPVESFQVTSFKVDSTTYTVNNTPQEMDVAPYVKDDRTYVPVRYLAYSLGVDEEGVTWDGEAKEVGIVSGETDIALTIGSTTMTVNNEPVIMDVPPEIKDGRTMLPARWVAESLGAEVEWDETTKQAIIKIPVTEPGD